MTSAAENRRRLRQTQYKRFNPAENILLRPQKANHRFNSMKVMPGSVSDAEAEMKLYTRGASRPGKRKPSLPQIVLKEVKWD